MWSSLSIIAVATSLGAAPSQGRLFEPELERAESVQQLIRNLADGSPTPREVGTSITREVEFRLPSISNDQPERSALELNRQRLLAVATPTFTRATQALGPGLNEVRRVAREVDSACAARSRQVPSGQLSEAVAQRCPPEGLGHTLVSAIRPVEARLQAWETSAHDAQAALDDLSAQGGASREVTRAVRRAAGALEQAEQAAEALITSALEASEPLDDFIADVRILQVALPLLPAPVGQPEHSGLDDSATINPFMPGPHRYLTVEPALISSMGMPFHPALGFAAGHQTLVANPPPQLAFGALASLEPLELLHREYPWSGVIRFPTVIVPITLNPFTDYFVGGGIGWNDIGSVIAGAHIAATTVPTAKTPYGTQFNSPPIVLDQVTQSGPMATGFFVSLSLDVLGIMRVALEDGLCLPGAPPS